MPLPYPTQGAREWGHLYTNPPEPLLEGCSQGMSLLSTSSSHKEAFVVLKEFLGTQPQTLTLGDAGSPWNQEDRWRDGETL